MENKEYTFKGTVMNGFLMLFVNLAVLILSIVGIVFSIIQLDESNGACGGWLLGGCILLLLINIMMWCGLMMLEPNEVRSQHGLENIVAPSPRQDSIGSILSMAPKKYRSGPVTSMQSQSR